MRGLPAPSDLLQPGTQPRLQVRVAAQLALSVSSTLQQDLKLPNTKKRNSDLITLKKKTGKVTHWVHQSIAIETRQNDMTHKKYHLCI